MLGGQHDGHVTRVLQDQTARLGNVCAAAWEHGARLLQWLELLFPLSMAPKPKIREISSYKCKSLSLRKLPFSKCLQGTRTHARSCTCTGPLKVNKTRPKRYQLFPLYKGGPGAGRVRMILRRAHGALCSFRRQKEVARAVPAPASRMLINIFHVMLFVSHPPPHSPQSATDKASEAWL